MDTSFQEFKAITDEYYKTGIMPEVRIFISLLSSHGIGLRQDDDSLHEITFSVPKSDEGLILGVRYQKKNSSFSEDLFWFREGKPIHSGYRGNLEKILPEYKDTHKGAPNT